MFDHNAVATLLARCAEVIGCSFCRRLPEADGRVTFLRGMSTVIRAQVDAIAGSGRFVLPGDRIFNIDVLANLFRHSVSLDRVSGSVNAERAWGLSTPDLARYVVELAEGIDGPRVRLPDIDLANRGPGCESKVKPEQGLARTISHIRETIRSGLAPMPPRPQSWWKHDMGARFPASRGCCP